jgi:hypothetical protein
MRLGRRRAGRLVLAALGLFRHASSPMLCLVVSVSDSDPRLAASCGVGIELIDILPC